ncbi:hypothetical protein E4U30_006784 [Claviceps sp. LM220 group G6]|nr:hypothetical protein E4U15_005310 [Claviceps sp. LM218 group G6]KAG6091521.1 hypothetical protein E4U30_006784 [Claviceps sp. LM220 group G6]KAG6116907.1 hypothetical protein E4U14_008281 [Claviceps sp. LM454 group G7]
MRAFSLLAFLLPLVAANEHRQCYCMSWSNDQQGWIHDEDLTHFTCAKDYYDIAKWDDGLKRCVAKPHQRIDGDMWENDCIAIGVNNGFLPFTPQGDADQSAPVKKVIHAVGSCPDRN